MKKTPEILKVKAIIDKLNGAEFDYRIFKELKYASVSISTLVKRGYIEIVRKHDTDDGRPFNIYKATGKVYLNYRLKKYNKPQEEVLIFGKYKLSEMPKSAVTVHRIQG
jgi:hypothetical protein